MSTDAGMVFKVVTDALALDVEEPTPDVEEPTPKRRKMPERYCIDEEKLKEMAHDDTIWGHMSFEDKLRFMQHYYANHVICEDVDKLRKQVSQVNIIMRETVQDVVGQFLDQHRREFQVCRSEILKLLDQYENILA